MARLPKAPGTLLSTPTARHKARPIHPRLPGAVKIRALGHSREVFIGAIPDRDGAVAQANLVPRPAPAAPPGCGVPAQTKLLRRLDGGDAGSGLLIAHGSTRLVGVGVCELIRALASEGGSPTGPVSREAAPS